MKKFINKSFKALIVIKKNKKFRLSFKKQNTDFLERNELFVKLNFTTINFKDTLVCKGNPGLVRKYPHVPGIDAAEQ